MTDPSIGQPVSEATVTLRKVVRTPGAPIRADELGQTQTNSAGRFSFPAGPGEYSLLVTKDGYTGAALPVAQANVVLEPDHPAQELALSLFRFGEIKGRLLDRDSGLPIAGLEVRVAPLTYRNGVRHFGIPGRRIVSNAEGEFSDNQLAPGEYVVLTAPGIFPREALVPNSDTGTAAAEPGYYSEFLPGGPDLDTALPTRVVSGIAANVGTISLRKGNRYTVNARLSPANCPGNQQDNQQVRVLLRTTWGNTTFDIADQEVLCGHDFALRGVQPGSYQLHVLAKTRPRLQGFSAFTVSAKDESIAVTLTAGAPVDGVVTVNGDPKAALPPDTRVIVTPIEALATSDDIEGLTPSPDGRFRKPSAPFGLYEVSVYLPATHSVREVSFKGQPLLNNTFAWDGIGSLAIDLDDQPASVIGTVRDDRGAVEAEVIYAQVGPHGELRNVTRIQTTAGGVFNLLGLPPGDFRLFAIAGKDRSIVDEPAAWQRLWSQSAKLSLDRNATYDVTLAPTNLPPR